MMSSLSHLVSKCMMPSVSDFKSHVGYSEFPPQALDMLGGECHSNKL